MKLRLIIVVILVAAVGFAFWKWREHMSQAEAELVLHGNVDIREVNLGFRVSGRIKEVLKDEGDALEPGEVLARLDAKPYRRELEQERAHVSSLKAKLEMLENGFRPEEVAQARAALEEREATLANAERLYDRQAELLNSNAVSQQEYEDAAARLKEAQARVNSARASLNLQVAGYRKEEIEQARADLARAVAESGTAEIHLEDTELKAPSAGVVITRAQEPGSIVQPGATVLTVSLEKPVWARVYVNEPHLGRVHPGAEVLIYTDSRPDRPYHGKVGFISPRAEFTPKNVETEELRTSLVYRLRVVVSDADPGLRQGMPVTVKLARQMGGR